MNTPSDGHQANPGVHLLNDLKLTDGVIFLYPLHAEDAPAHLAGEDQAMARWVSGGRSTLATVQSFITNSLENWKTGGPRRASGIFDCATQELIGFIEVNLAPALEPGQVNISYGIYPQWRGQGIAPRAIELIHRYVRTATDARQMVLRIAPANTASLRVAEKAGFAFCDVFNEPQGQLVRYVRNVAR